MKILPKILTVITIFLIFAIDTHGYGESSGGVTASNVEPYGNIVKYEVREGNLIYNQSVEYSFTSPEFGIYKVLINGNKTEYDIPVRIENLRNTSVYAKSAPGIVYRNENIWIGTKRINYISVRFKVKNSWMTENNLNETNYPYLLRWSGNSWLVLKTNITGKDGLYTYLESPRAGNTYIGIFAISAPPKRINRSNNNKNSTDWPAHSSENEEEIIPEIETIQEKNSPGFESIVPIILLLIIYIFKKGKR